MQETKTDSETSSGALPESEYIRFKSSGYTPRSILIPSKPTSGTSLEECIASVQSQSQDASTILSITPSSPKPSSSKPGGQSRRWSIIETVISTAVGFIVSWLLTAYIVPLLWPSVHPTHSQAAGMTLLFTVASLIRGFGLRRLFNRVYLWLET